MLWEQLNEGEKKICELLVNGNEPNKIAKLLKRKRRRTAKDNLRYVQFTLSNIYVRFDIPKTRHRYVVLAVALTFDRSSDLLPRSGLYAETGHCQTGGRASLDNQLHTPIFYRQPTESDLHHDANTVSG